MKNGNKIGMAMENGNYYIRTIPRVEWKIRHFYDNNLLSDLITLPRECSISYFFHFPFSISHAH